MKVNAFAAALKDGFLTVQRQMVSILHDEYCRQQSGRCQPLINDVRRYRRLIEGLATITHVFRTNVILHAKSTGHIIQFLTHLIPKMTHLSTTTTGRAFQRIMNIHRGNSAGKRIRDGVRGVCS